MKRIFLTFLCVCLVLSCLVSCVGSTQEESTTITEDNEFLEYYQIPEDYVIVYSLESSDGLKDEIKVLRSKLQNLTGEKPTVTTDDDLQTKFEIQIGEVARKSRMRISTAYTLSGTDYIVKLEDNCLVILGANDDATIDAIEAFMNQGLKSNEYKLYVENNYCSIYQVRGSSTMNGITILEQNENNLIFEISPSAGNYLDCKLSFTGNNGWRLQTKLQNETFDDLGAAQYLSDLLKEDKVYATKSIGYKEETNVLTLTEANGTKAVLNASPFSLSFYSASGACIQTITSVSATSTSATVSGTILKDEAIYGTGERFNGTNQRGNKISMYALDQWNVIGGNGYMPIPLLLFTRGSGIFMNRYERMTIDLGNTNENLWSINVEKAPVDLYIYAVDYIGDAINGYSALTGYASMPEEWNFGMLVCRYSPDFSNTNIQSIYDMVDAMEANDLPWTGIILEAWDTYNTSTYEDLKTVVNYIHSLGKKVLMYCRMGVVYTNKVTLPSNEYLLHIVENGKIAIPDVSSSVQNPDASSSGTTHYYLDVTNEDACEWFFNEIWGTLVYDVGIDGAKIDFCELLPDSIELTFENGTTSGAHHWYPTYFNTLFYKMVASKPDGGMIFARGGGIGSGRNSFMWAGDQTREFTRLKAQLSAVLSSGLSGVPFMSFDMAGYKASTQKSNKDNEATVFIRGTQMTAFLTSMQTHGNVTRPYEFDDTTVDIYRAYCKIHELLIPYFMELSEEACTTGMPFARHLILNYPKDTNVYNIDDEFMLGNALLVAPELEGKTSRDIYLPQGTWKDLNTGTIYVVGEEGKVLKNYAVSISQIPLFVNSKTCSNTLKSCLEDIAYLLEEMK